MRTGKRLLELNSATLAILTALAGVLLLPASADEKRQPVLSPDRFSYPMKLGYIAAQQYPETIAKVFCYCGCDRQDGHNSLMDCYVTTHGAYCAICMEEAIDVKDMKKKQATLPAVQQHIEDRFAKYYPFFPNPSAQCRKYRETLKSEGVKIRELNVATNQAAPAKAGSCCKQDIEGR